MPWDRFFQPGHCLSLARRQGEHLPVLPYGLSETPPYFGGYRPDLQAVVFVGDTQAALENGFQLACAMNFARSFVGGYGPKASVFS